MCAAIPRRCWEFSRVIRVGSRPEPPLGASEKSRQKRIVPRITLDRTDAPVRVKIAAMASTDAPELSRESIHVWTVPSAAPDDAVAALGRVLNTEETERVARFQFAHLRDSFVIAHGILRFLLGRYLKIDPAKIQFSFNSKGKPAATEGNGLKFNMSHSGGLTVIALAMECEIGVDVEKIRPLSDMLRIAERYFCQEEAAELRSLPSDERENGFFCCWTRKEAYIKAIGAGLSAPLNGFRVAVDPRWFRGLSTSTTISPKPMRGSCTTSTWLLVMPPRSRIELHAAFCASLQSMISKRSSHWRRKLGEKNARITRRGRFLSRQRWQTLLWVDDHSASRPSQCGGAGQVPFHAASTSSRDRRKPCELPSRPERSISIPFLC